MLFLVVLDALVERGWIEDFVFFGLLFITVSLFMVMAVAGGGALLQRVGLRPLGCVALRHGLTIWTLLVFDVGLDQYTTFFAAARLRCGSGRVLYVLPLLRPLA